MIYKQLISRVLLLLVFALSASLVVAQEEASAEAEGSAAEAEASAEGGKGAANIEEGKTLFRNYCATCHAKNMKDDLTGPALGGVEERWADYPEEHLYRWIRQSQAMIEEGHPRAVELWEEWGPTVMNNFLNLSDQEIANILGYIDAVHTGKIGGKKKQEAGEEVAVVQEKPNNTPLFIALAVILGILAIVLARIVSNLNYMLQVKEAIKLPAASLWWKS